MIPHLASLLRDYGRRVDAEEGISFLQLAALFETLLKACLEAVVRRQNDDALALAEALQKLVGGEITVRKAYERLRDNNAKTLCEWVEGSSEPIEWETDSEKEKK